MRQNEYLWSKGLKRRVAEEEMFSGLRTVENNGNEEMRDQHPLLFSQCSRNQGL